jgi:hypothetical protein
MNPSFILKIHSLRISDCHSCVHCMSDATVGRLVIGIIGKNVWSGPGLVSVLSGSPAAILCDFSPVGSLFAMPGL